MQQNSQNGTLQDSKNTGLLELSQSNPALFSKEVSRLTVEQAIALNDPNRKQLSAIKKENESLLFASLETTLDMFSQLCGANLNEFVLEMLSTSIATEYWFLTFEEIILALRNGVQGKYNFEGQFSTQFNLLSVLSWLRSYTEGERIITIEKIRESEHEMQKSMKPDLSVVEISEMYKNRTMKDWRRESEKEDDDYKKFKAEFYKSILEDEQENN